VNDEQNRAVRPVTVLAVLLVAAIAAVVSYSHMVNLATAAGEGWRAHLLPLSVDGLLVAASMTMLTRRRAGIPAGWLAWLALVGGIGASLAANIAAAEPDVTARLIAGWPAVAFAVSFELLLQQGRVPAGDRPGDWVTGPPGGWVTAGDPGDRVGEADQLAARTRELVHAARATGRPLGRRRVARELGVSEHRAKALLSLVGAGGEVR
jgi:hypothetical protein